MGAIAFRITSLTIVYSIVYSDADQRKHQSSASLAYVRGNSPGTGEFPAQMAWYAENVSIWRRHYVIYHFSLVIRISSITADMSRIVNQCGHFFVYVHDNDHKVLRITNGMFYDKILSWQFNDILPRNL